MSHAAVAWALQQDVPHSSAKFVLVVMAHCVNHEECGGSFLSWPSTAHIEEATGQNRKTVMENMKRLREWGFIEDTNERRGVTGSVPVYRLSSPKNGPAKNEKSGCDEQELPQKQSQKRTEDSPKTGQLDELEAVPFSDGSSTVFGHKQSQKRTEDSPKTGHGRGKKGKEGEEEREKRASPRSVLPLPDWLPESAWSDWDEFRQKRDRKAWTDKAQELSLKTLATLHAGGFDPVRVIEQSIERGWSGLFALKTNGEARASPSATPNREDSRRVAAKTRLSDVMNDDGTLKTRKDTSDERTYTSPHAPRLMG